jgi:hypothetical protein
MIKKMKKLIISLILSLLFLSISYSQTAEEKNAKVTQKETVTGAKTKYIDKNGDGINDLLQNKVNGKGNAYGKTKQEMKGNKDRFIDADGDGICDSRAKGLGFKFLGKGPGMGNGFKGGMNKK